MRSRFDEQLATLDKELIEMGALCEEAIADAAKALTTADEKTAAKVEPLEAEINQKERDIESLCLKMLLQQQPVARDLRQISAALKMITDLERIGDQASDIAEIITFIDKKAGVDCEPICLMAEATIRMVTESVDAFVKRDVGIAQQAIAHDDTVDDYFLKVKRSLINMISQRPANGEHALDLLMIAKYFERIGDHAVNSAEGEIFSATGVRKGRTG